MNKKTNKEYLNKIQRTKKFAYPVLNFLDRTRLLPLLIPVINFAIRKAGIKKKFQKDLNYRLVGKAYKNVFSEKVVGDKVIIVPFMSGGNNIFLLLNFLITHFLSKKGYRPIFFICDKAMPICNNERILKDRESDASICNNCYNPYKFLEKMTGATVMKISDYLNIEEQDIFFSDLKSLKTIDNCKNYVYKGYPIGAIAEKSVLRYFYVGDLQNDNPQQIAIYRKTILSLFYFLNAWENYHTKLGIKPSLVLLYNGTLSFESLIRHYCKENAIDYVTNETYIGGSSWIYKKNNEVMLLRWPEQRKAFQSQPINSQELNKAKEFLEGLRVGKNMYAKLNEKHDLDDRLKDGNYVALFTNLIFDTAVLGRNPVFHSMHDWIMEVIKYWKKHKIQTKLVIRIHPGELKLITVSNDFVAPRIRELIKDADNIILFDASDKINSYDLIDNMRFGLIYSSTIGMEIAYYNKKCIIAGDAFYKEEPFATFHETRENYFAEIERSLNDELSLNFTKEDVLRFIYFIYFVRTKQMNGIEMDHVNHVNTFTFEDAEDLMRKNKHVLNEFANEMLG